MKKRSPQIMRKSKLSHVDSRGQAMMVDVAAKPRTERAATASGRVMMKPATFELIAGNLLAKGDVLALARIAGIQAAKQTHHLIPLGHPLALTSVEVECRLDQAGSLIEVTGTARCTDRTGAEMEALTAVAVACLTIYDMAKAAEKGMVISDIKLVEKRGGRSGHWKR